MKKYIEKKCKSENGAILYMSVIVMTALIIFTAFAVDFGYTYYLNAKLQNAVDAAATAAASVIDATDESRLITVKRYLGKNGFNEKDFNDGDFNVDVTTKHVYDIEDAEDDDNVVGAGYVKVVVDANTKTFFAQALNIDSFHLHRESFAKCTVNYDNFPKALKYTLFAASTDGTRSDPAMSLAGKTGDLTNNIVGGLEDIINGIYQIYYNVSEFLNSAWGTDIFKNLGTNDLVHLNTSEIIINGDAHSNSTIDVGVQAINVSRLKDGVNEKLESPDNELIDDNFGQVTFTAMKSINFSSKQPNRRTHVYVQNMDCVSKTQETLRLLKMNPSNLAEYEELITEQLANGDIFQNVANQISSNPGGGQEGNISINSSSINVNNQKAIVYDVGQQTANQMLTENTDDGFEETVKKASTEDTLGAAYQDENKANSSFSMSANTDLTDKDGKAITSKTIGISGTQINRQLENSYFSQDSTNYQVAYAKAKVAMATAFQGDLGWDGYIETPDMTTYFSRQLWKSVTQTANDSSIRNKRDSDKIIKQYVDLLNAKYINQTAFKDTTGYYDKTVTTESAMLNKLNVNTKANRQSGLVKIEDRSKILGYTLFNVNDENEIVSERKATELVKDGYDLLQYDPNGTGEENEAKRYTDKDAVELYKEKIDSSEASYEDKYNDIRNKYTKGLIDANIKSKAVNKTDIEQKSYDGSRIEQTKWDWSNPEVTAESINEMVTVSQPAKAKTVDSFDFSDLDTDDVWLDKKDGSTGSDSDDDTPYNRLLSAWKSAHLDDVNGSYIPTVFNYSVSFPKHAGTYNFSYASSSGNASGSSITLYSQYYDNASTNKNSVAVESNSKTIIGGNISSSKNVDVKSNSILVVNGNVTASGVIQIRSNSKLFVRGTISCDGFELEDGAQIYCAGNARADRWNDLGGEHKVVIGGDLDMSYDDVHITITARDRLYVHGMFKTYVLYNYTDEFVCGSYYNEGAMDTYWVGGTNYNGFYNNPGCKMYIMNDFTNLYTSDSSADLYIGGNADLGRLNVQASNSLKVSSGSNTYIGGTINANGHNIYMPSESTATGVFSVYGNGAVSNDTTVSNCDDFAFYAKKCRVYLNGDSDTYSIKNSHIKNNGDMYAFGSVGTKSIINGTTTYTQGVFAINGSLNATDTFNNYCKVYVNGKMISSSSVTNDSTGSIYIQDSVDISSNLNNAGVFDVKGNVKCNGTVNSTHEVYVEGNYYAMNGLTQTGGETHVMGYIESAGGMRLGGIIHVASYVKFGGTSDFSGNIYINGNLTSLSSGVTVSGNSLLFVNGRISVGAFSNNSFTAVAQDIYVSNGDFYNSNQVYTCAQLNVKGSVTSDGGIVNVPSYIIATGSMNINGGKITALSYVDVGALKMNNSSILYAGNYITVSGDIAGTGSVYSQLYVKCNSMNLNGEVVSNGAVRAMTGILTATQGLTANGFVYSLKSITLGGNVNINGYLYATLNITFNSGSNVYVNEYVKSITPGNYSLSNSGDLYVQSYISIKCTLNNSGTITVAYNHIESDNIINSGTIITNTGINSSGSISTSGNMVTNSYIRSSGGFNNVSGSVTAYDSLNCTSFTNSGNVSLGANIQCTSCTNNNAAQLYAKGDCSFGSITNNGDIYITSDGYGCSVSSRSGMYNSGSFGCMGDVDIANGTLENQGSVYVDGSVKVSKITAANAGKTYVYYDLSANGAINVSGNHELVSGGTITAYFISSTGGSKVYAVTGCSIGNGGFTVDSQSVDNISELFCGPNSVKHDGCEVVINGRFFFPEVSGTWSFTKLSVGIYGRAHFACDVIVTSSISVDDGGRLYIEGTTKLRDCYLTLLGRAEGYFMGGLEMDKSARKNVQNIGNYNMVLSDNSTLYCGGGSDWQMQFTGCFQMRGTAVFDCNVTITGWDKPDQNRNFDTAVTCINNSITLVSGNLYGNGNGVFVAGDAILNVKGELDYGGCLLNANKLVVYGGITQNEHNQTINYDTGKLNGAASNDGGVTEGRTDLGGFAVRNGYVANNNGFVYNNKAILYNGNKNTFTLGGCFQNWGTYYGEGSISSTDSSWYNGSTVLAQQNTRTFIAGDVYSTRSVALMNNTIFMCDGDFTTHYALKVNIDPEFTDNDQFTRNYTYIGGNMLCNKTWNGYGGKTHNQSGDLDVFSNSNVLIKGSAFLGCKLYLKENTSFIVCGNQVNPQNKDYSMYIGRCLDHNIASTMVVGNLNSTGSMYVGTTCKIRDMARSYIYGDLYTGDYLEIGKALDGNDETEALSNTYKKVGESKKRYVFSNAGMVSVKGNAYSSKYTKIYASTTFKVGGDFSSASYLTLRHDAKLYVGKKCKAGTSIDGGSYSQMHIGGSLQAVSSTIKIRDCTQVDVGGNLYAASYIELGKAGDYTRTVNGNNITEYFNGTNTTLGTVDEGGEIEGDGGDGSTATGGNSSETVNENPTTDEELLNDSSDKAKGATFYVGKSIYSYTKYIMIFRSTDVTCGGFVYTPRYITLRSSASLNVQPEMFGNETHVAYDPASDDDEGFFTQMLNVLKEKFTAKAGSVYAFGIFDPTELLQWWNKPPALTLNKNAALTATYDVVLRDKTVLREDSFIYTQHDFALTAPSMNLTWDSITGKNKITGFDSCGTAVTKNVTNADGSVKSKTTEYPVMIYAGNDINVATTISMRMTYMIAGNNVTLADIYSNADNAEQNAEQLPNSICALQGDIKYWGLYSKFGGLFYAPNGKLDLDGVYLEIWGSGIGKTVEVNAFYLNLHRFENWRTLKLKIPTSNTIYLIDEDAYNAGTADADD